MALLYLPAKLQLIWMQDQVNMVLYSKENHLFSSEQQFGSLLEKSNFLA